MSITAGLVVKSKMLFKNDVITMVMLSFTETFNSFPIHQFSHLFQIGKIDNIRVQLVSTMILYVMSLWSQNYLLSHFWVQIYQKSDLWCKLRNDHSWTHGKGCSRFTKTNKTIFNPECRCSFLSLQITKKSSFTTFSFCLNLPHFWKAMKTVYFATRLKNWEVTFPSFKIPECFLGNFCSVSLFLKTETYDIVQ